MSATKIFILLPDGVGLRNFAFTDFYKIGKDKGFDLFFWNNTPFDLNKLGFKEIKLKQKKSNFVLEILKNARKEIELNSNKRKSKDITYDSYRFPFSYSGLKSSTKSIAVRFLTMVFDSEKGLKIIRNLMIKAERNTIYYSECLTVLKEEKPSFVFCTNQRHTATIAPILAATDLGIPTATFIFSWDNLPKGTMVIETDYYFVWSLHMKNELLYYYPYIQENQVIITGTPQFENHFKEANKLEKKHFFMQNGLDFQKRYICYSGDDITTSPNDPLYLSDLILAVRKLNEKGNNLGVIFRRCPVDFSNRFDLILKNNSDVVTSIIPLWDKIGEGWNTILPTKEDAIMQMNIIAHTEMVINLGSSMVFDYAAHRKPCGFMNYNDSNENSSWSVQKIYNYIHFRSMPNKDCVFWLNSPEEIADKVELMLGVEAVAVVNHAQEWFKKINLYPAQEASERIWEGITKICKK